MDTQDISVKKSKKKSAEWLKVLGVGLLVIAACGLSFVGGVAYQKKQPVTQVATGGLNGEQGIMGGPGGMRQGGTLGTVTAVSATSISIENSRTGTTSTLTIDSSTVISNNGATIAVSNIKVGDTVLATTSTTDAKKAARISINPTMPSFGGRESSSATPDSIQSN